MIAAWSKWVLDEARKTEIDKAVRRTRDRYSDPARFTHVVERDAAAGTLDPIIQHQIAAEFRRVVAEANCG